MQATITTTNAQPVAFWSALFTDRRIAPAMGLGFASGMPFLLTYSTQSAWLSDAGVPLGTIGLLSELTLAYKFKFVWAPFLDQYDPPLVGRLLTYDALGMRFRELTLRRDPACPGCGPDARFEGYTDLERMCAMNL